MTFSDNQYILSSTGVVYTIAECLRDVYFHLWSLTPSGTFTTTPSRAFVMHTWAELIKSRQRTKFHTWHPRRDSSVRPKARSNMSNSSSVASSSIFAKSSWKHHIKISLDPGKTLDTDRCEHDMTSGAGKSAFTGSKPVQVDVIVDGNVQQVVTLFCLQFRN